jgi:hypothetical protein
VGGILDSNCTNCPFAESIPPLDRWVLRTPQDIATGTTLATMENYVTQAESNGGGWVVLVFHSVCDGGCDTLSVTPGQLTAFLDWLQPRAAGGTVVKTVGEAMTGVGPPPPVADTTAPVTTISCNAASCAKSAYRSALTVTLSATDAGSGVATTRYTTNGTDPTATNGTTYTAPFTISASATVKFRSTDNAGNIEAVKSTSIKVR